MVCYLLMNVSLIYDAIQDMLRRKAAKPYSAIVDSAKAEAIPRDTFYLMSPQHMPSPVSHSSTFGTGGDIVDKFKTG